LPLPPLLDPDAADALLRRVLATAPQPAAIITTQ
jgi:hypothetical protein